MDVNTAARILDITLPCEQRRARSAFRRLAFLHHPDRGGSSESFHKIEEAYRTIENNPGSFKTSTDSVTKTVNGIDLSTLGKGYQLNVSARTCSDCDGAGYRILREPRIDKCKHCIGTGWKHVPCNRCNGTGKFKVNGVVKGSCRGCEGTGFFVPHDYWLKTHSIQYRFSIFDIPRYPRDHYCEHCSGIGTVWIEDGSAYALVCDTCKGIGEIKMFNPVLPRGLLVGKNL